MDICYVVITHKDPHQVRRLIARLQHPDSYFYVHVDGAVPLAAYEEALADLPHVHFVENRIRVAWGSWMMVELQLLGIAQAIRDGREGFCMLISGQDYPIKHPDKLRALLESNPQKLFINSVPIDEVWEDYRTRVEHYSYPYREPYRYVLRVAPLFHREFFTWRNFDNLARLLIYKREWKVLGQLFKPRKYPEGFLPYGGSAWWALPTDFIREILRVHREHPALTNLFRYSFVPDELYFQTVTTYLNGPKKLLNRVTYDNWLRTGVELPVTFSERDDLQLLLDQPEYIARKFAPDSPILDALDEALGFEPWQR